MPFRKELLWDSAFFKRPVFRVEVETCEPRLFKKHREFLTAAGVERSLTYWIAKEGECFDTQFLKQYGGTYVGDKIDYVMFLKDFSTPFSERPSPVGFSLRSRRPCRMSQCLFDLALSASHESRFRKDPRVSADKADELFRIWIDKSLNGELADRIFTSHHEVTSTSGVVTVSINGPDARIGLVAVDSRYRRSGIGIALMNHTLTWLANQSIQSVFVATQCSNDHACRFYEKLGFKKFKGESIHHFWIDQ